MNASRRTFLQASAAAVVAQPVGQALASAVGDETLAGEVGITTSSLSGHIAARPADGKFTLLELPKILREDLDMKVIDLNTSTLASTKPAYLEQVRQAADDAGCILTNLKMNQRGLNMNSLQIDVRQRALAEYKKSIDAAAILGLRWVRPLPLAQQPDMKIHIASYQELCEYAAQRNIQLLVENYGWMQAHPASVVRLVNAIGKNVAGCPDTGNWDSNEIRYQGLAASFPVAVTCDFKARELSPTGEHQLYDLHKCFQIGWQAGFRGPWCLEHANADRKTLFRELALLRDMLRGWMKA